MTDSTLDSSAIYTSLGEKSITAVDKFRADQCGASQTFQSDVFRAGVGQEVQRDAVQTVQSSAFQTVQKETLQLVCSGADQAAQSCAVQEIVIEEDHLGKVQEDQSVKVCNI